MPINMFDTREMLPMLEEAKTANSFLKNLFSQTKSHMKPSMLTLIFGLVSVD